MLGTAVPGGYSPLGQYPPGPFRLILDGMRSGRALATCCSALVLCGLFLAGCAKRSEAQAASGASGAEAPAIVYLSPTGSDTAACTKTAPCRSLNRAYFTAKPGQVVELAAGTYPEQERIGVDSTKLSGTDVVFRPAAGAAVSLPELTVAGSHLELRGMQIAGWTTWDSADDVTFRDMKSGFFFIRSSKNISVIGGEVGPGNDFDSQVSPGSGSAPVPTNILINGVFFHDWRLTPGSDAHVECLQIGEVDGLTIANSRFNNCETHYVFISPFFGGALKNIRLVNNMGGSVVGYYGFRVAAGREVCENISFRYNSAVAPYLIDCGTVNGTAVMDSNVGGYQEWLCRSNITYTNNVWTAAKCGATDIQAPSGFRDAAAFDLHLAPGAVAIDRGNPDGAPTRDIDGESRPLGAGPDAGADEFPQPKPKVAAKPKPKPKKKAKPKPKKKKS